MYRTIETSIWSDPAFRDLPANGKLLFIYLVTNIHTHVSGIYYLPTSLAAYETKLAEPEIDTLWDTLSGVGLSRRDKKTEVIWVVNMFRYQGKGRKNEKSAGRQLATLHNTPLIKDFLTKYPAVKRHAKDRVSDTLSRVGASCLQEQEQEQDKKHLPAEAAGDGKKGKARTKPAGDHAALCDHFVTRWENQYGAKYVFQAKDGVAAAKVLKAVGTLHEACDLVDRYLGDANKFLAEQKHPLPMLVNQINRFTANAGTAGASAGGDPDNFVPVRPDVADLPWNRGGK